MAVRRETGWESLKCTLRFVLLPNWKLGLLLLILVATGLFALHRMGAPRPQPAIEKEGRIVRFGFAVSKNSLTPSVIVVVALPNGRPSEFRIASEQIANCRVGDRITYRAGPDGVQVKRCALPPLEIRD